METAALLVVAVLIPTALGYSVVGVRRLHAMYRASRPPLPTTKSPDQLRKDLRRLHDLLDRTESAPSNVLAKNLRCQATRAAYLDVLRIACEQVQVPLPSGSPVSRAEIYRVESDLRHRGIDVRTS